MSFKYIKLNRGIGLFLFLMLLQLPAWAVGLPEQYEGEDEVVPVKEAGIDREAPAASFSEDELRAQGLIKAEGKDAKAVAQDGDYSKKYGMPAIYVKVSRVVYERQSAVSGDHRRRSLASRGSLSSGTVAVRKKVDVDITPFICRYAEKYNLDPWLVRAVIETESNFDPYAGSWAGAGGLMQLMPATASGLGCSDRFDPESNIAAGCRYLRQMLNMFKNDYRLAIAAYNAGPGNVCSYGGVPPFRETQNYVVRVTSRWQKGKKSAAK